MSELALLSKPVLVWIATDTDPRLKWIATHCVQMSPRFYTCQPADAG
jgi:hypothetical protein